MHANYITECYTFLQLGSWSRNTLLTLLSIFPMFSYISAEAEIKLFFSNLCSKLLKSTFPFKLGTSIQLATILSQNTCRHSANQHIRTVLQLHENTFPKLLLQSFGFQILRCLQSVLKTGKDVLERFEK